MLSSLLLCALLPLDKKPEAVLVCKIKRIIIGFSSLQLVRFSACFYCCLALMFGCVLTGRFVAQHRSK